MSFVHLHLHSEYSISDGTCRIRPLVEAAASLDMPALAVSDQGNLFAMVKFYRAAQRVGVKPLIGADVRLRGDDTDAYRLVLLCQDQEGYQNLTHLVTRSYREGQQNGVPYVDSAWFEGHSHGLIALTPGEHGDIARVLLNGQLDAAKRKLDAWRRLFPDRYYLAIQRVGRERQEELIEHTVALASSEQVPVVATNAVCFVDADDFAAHEARVCINEGRVLADSRRPRNYTDKQYLRSPSEMRAVFADLPEALRNTELIAQRCNLQLTLGEYHLPQFHAPDHTTVEALCRLQASEGLQQRLTDASRDDPSNRYSDRLRQELDVIVQMGFAGYFLIVADFIRWAKENRIPVGPGRGSGAGSLVAYALGITELDPITYGLLFERFLNPERVSMPDFDIDFCMDRRDEVIEYVADHYGRDHVSQIITYGSMAAKAVVRDVGRVLGYPYGFVDQIAKLIPFELNITLQRALKEEPLLRERYDKENDVRDLIDLAQKLEGLTRNAGRHAGGVVISPRPLTHFMPLYCEQGSTVTVTQFDMSDVEAVGLVKFDFLGLRTLTIIDWALQTINQSNDTDIDILNIPLDEPAAFDLIQQAQTTAVFQLESRGMKELIKRLRPDSFEDLIALVALFRPGPLQSGMVDDFVDRKHGRAAVRYPHSELESILQPTYGVILYQEQVMQIAQVLAGYTLGAADLLRRAMGKKKPEEMARQREIFLQGATQRQVDAGVAAGIFDLMEKFAGYGFNKSHSAAYALVAYQTAWLKAKHPAAFMAAVLSADMDNTDKILSLIDECRHMEIQIEGPDINASKARFAAGTQAQIRYGLAAIKGVGGSAVESLVGERSRSGPYKDIYDLCKRVDTKKANRRVLEALICAGALDSLGASRSTLMASLPSVLQTVEQQAVSSAVGQSDLFGLATGTDGPLATDREVPLISLQLVEEWSEGQRLAGEKGSLGLYLSGHPIHRYLTEFGPITSCRLADLKPGSRRVLGLVVALRNRNSSRGRMTLMTIDDSTARVEVVVYAEALKQCAAYLVKDRVVLVKGTCKLDDFSGGHSIVADRVSDIDQIRQRSAQRLVIKIGADDLGPGFDDTLKGALGPYVNGTCPVVIDYWQAAASAQLALDGKWRVRLCDELLDRLAELFGEAAVLVEYGNRMGVE